MAKLKYMGLGLADRTIIIYVDVEINGVKRAAEVRVPIDEFLRDEVSHDLNLAHARKLRRLWEEPAPPWEVELPLPGIG